MQFEWIKYFFSLSECHSFSKAANQLMISQSSLSKKIGMLEDELGLKLFNRKSHAVELTEEGRIMCEFFREAEKRFQSAAQQARPESDSTKLSVVMMDSLVSEIALDPLFRYQRSRPDIHLALNIEQMAPYDIPVAIEQGQYDLAITLEDKIRTTSYSPQLETLPICDASLRLYYSKNRKKTWAGDMPELNDFREDTFYLPMSLVEPQHVEGEYVKDNAFLFYTQLLGYRPNFEIVEFRHSIRPNIESGSGVAIMSELSGEGHSVYLESIPLPVSSRLVLAWRKNCKKDIIHFLKESYQGGLS